MAEKVGDRLTLIAVTCKHSFTQGFSLIEDDYILALEQAGGQPMVLPPTISPKTSSDMLRQAKGLLLSGGDDLAPLIFSEQPHPCLGSVDALRDEQELALVAAALDMGLPILGICRGMQVINVAMGGALVQHLPENGQGAIQHRQSAPGWHRHHQVNVKPGTLLASILGAGNIGVNSFHHQGAAKLGHGLEVGAVSPDGLVEAVESVQPWILGVQWHPERMQQRYSEFLKIFLAFVAACKKNRS